jgi:hypothetical protein
MGLRPRRDTSVGRRDAEFVLGTSIIKTNEFDAGVSINVDQVSI